MLPITYLLPIRSALPLDDELTGYLRDLSTHCPVVVVDGSADPVFAEAHASLACTVTHVAPHPRHRCANGKVHGVMTGFDHVSTPAVVIADDDVRYTRDDLDELVNELADADLIVPQNYFGPLPWHARWDTARTLLNRVSGGDFPGTLALNMRALHAAGGGYDGNVLFENLELMRTVEAAGGTCQRRSDLYVRRLPPTTRHFLGQRVRQAYDEFARPVRMVAALAVLPTTLLVARRRARWLAPAATMLVLAAEIGRRRHGGRDHFPWTSSLLAPVWVAERAVCAWLALAARLTGGITYAGARLVTAANSTRSLQRRSPKTSGTHDVNHASELRRSPRPATAAVPVSSRS
jgi:hypothetical protein